MRITHTQMTQSVKDQLTRRVGRLEQAWRHVSSGRRVERPSDDPAAIARILTYRSLRSEVEQRRFQVESGLSLLNTVDTVLDSADNLMIKAHEMAVNSGSPGVSEENLRSLAEQVSGLIEQLQDMADTKYDNRALFAQGKANTSAIDMAGLELPRDEVFKSSKEALENLRDDLLAGERASDDTLGALQAGLDSLLSYRTQVGVRVNRLESLEARLLSMEQDLIARTSGDEEVDLGRAIVDLKEEEAAYQAALTATARMMRLSLADFL